MKSNSAFIIVAIDGGAASGKSSTARGLARRFGFLHVDTGAHYRALTLMLLQAGIALEQEAEVAAFLREAPLETHVVLGQARMTIGAREPAADELRSEAVNTHVSQVAAIAAVRRHLFHYQRAQADIARQHGFQGLVMEGRDIGSVIFPDAPLRFFLEADVETRARRRAKEGLTDSVDTRDRMDTSRKTAPLICPPGARRIDTSRLTLEQVIDTLAEAIRERVQAAQTPAE